MEKTAMYAKRAGHASARVRKWLRQTDAFVSRPRQDSMHAVFEHFPFRLTLPVRP